MQPSISGGEHKLVHGLYRSNQTVDDWDACFPFLDRSLGFRQCSSIINSLKSRPTQIFMQLLSVLSLTTETLRGGRTFLLGSLPAVVYLLRVTSQCHVLELFICESRTA
jgi:hypothetical protein